MNQRFRAINGRTTGLLVAASLLVILALAPQQASAAWAPTSCTVQMPVYTPSRVPLTIDVAKSCADPLGGALTFGTPVLVKATGTISGANGVYSYTSHDLFTGADQLQVTVTSPNWTTTATVPVNAVQNSADPVCHLATAYAVYGGGDSVSGRIVCDTSGDVTFRGLPPEGKQVGTLTMLADGTFTWKAPAKLPEIPVGGFSYTASSGGFEQRFGALINFFDASIAPVTRAKFVQDMDTAIEKMSIAPGPVVCVGPCGIATTFTLAGPAAKALGFTKRAAPFTVAHYATKRFIPTGENAAYYDKEILMQLAYANLSKATATKLAKAKKPVTLTETVVVDDNDGARKITRLVVLRP